MPQGAGFSLLGLFMQADPIVKGVMLLLVAASVGVWTVVIDKLVRFARLRRETVLLDAMSRNAALVPGAGLAGDVVRAGLAAREEAGDEWGRESRAERRERVRDAMRMVLGDGLRPMEPGLPFLATTGSAAPFVGLFGTVWGIMNSFASIASANDTSLAVVAPGIAEALLSTAIGLAAAIPAVIAYNRLVTDLGRSRAVAGAAIGRLAGRLAGGQAGDQPGDHPGDQGQVDNRAKVLHQAAV